MQCCTDSVLPTDWQRVLNVVVTGAPAPGTSMKRARLRQLGMLSTVQSLPCSLPSLLLEVFSREKALRTA